MIPAKQSTAKTFMVGPVLDADGVAVTGGVIADFKISKNGAAPAAFDGSATLTHRHTGFYSLAATANDFDTVGTAQVTIDDTVNACPMLTFQVVEEVIYDAIYASTANAFAGAAGSTTLGAGAITATVIATGAIDADAIADNAIDAGAIASDAITAAKIATGAISAAKFAAGAIDAAAIANGAIDAATFAADVDAEILSYIVDDATRIDASALNTASVTTIPAIVADTNELQTDWANGGRLDLLIDAIGADTDGLIATSATVNDAGALTTQFNTTLTEVDDFWNDAILTFTSGALAGQSRTITDFANTNGRITFDEALTSAPANGVSFKILSSHVHPTTQIATAVRTNLATELARIDVATSTRASQTSVDDVPTVAEFDARTLLAANYATAAALATVDGIVDNIIIDTNELQTDWANGGRLDLILDAALADTNELQTDWANGGRLDLLLDAALADTNELQTDWVNGGRLDLILDARASQTSVDDLPTNAELATALGTADDAVLAVLTTVEGKIDTIDTVVDAVKLKTDLLPEGPSKNAQFTYVIKMVDSTDHVTPKTGLTVTMTRSLDGAAFGAATGTVTEISTGHYKVVASAADMNGDIVAHRLIATGADDFTMTFLTTV